MANIDELLAIIEKLEAQFGTSFTLMVSADSAEATDLVKKYMA